MSVTRVKKMTPPIMSMEDPYQDNFSKLPNDLIGYIYTFIPIQEVEYNMALINKKFKSIIDKPITVYMRRTLHLCYANVNKHTINMNEANKIILKLVQKYKNITSLKLINSVISDDIIFTLVKSLYNLKKLDISGIMGFSSISIATIGMNCTKLTEFNASNNKLSDNGFEIIFTNCFDLEKVFLDMNYNLTNKSVRLLANCPKLTHLSLKNCSNITIDGIIDLSINCLDLIEINITGTRISTYNMVPFVTNCRKLERIITGWGM